MTHFIAMKQHITNRFNELGRQFYIELFRICSHPKLAANKIVCMPHLAKQIFTQIFMILFVLFDT